MYKGKAELPLDLLPTICLISLVSLSSSSPSPIPHLDHLLSLALQTTLQHTPPQSYSAWLERLVGPGDEQGLREVKDTITEQVRFSSSSSS
jgi:hypothetical protein